jgi:hypothetical protein
MSDEQERPPNRNVTGISTDLIGARVETAKGKRGVVRLVAVLVDPTFGPELHLWIEDHTDYGDPEVALERKGALVRVEAKGTRVLS